MVDAVSDLSELLANAKGDRSIDAIAAQASSAGHPISRSAVAKYLRGKHGTRPPEATLEALAAGFGVSVRKLRIAAGRPAGELGPWRPTPLANSLTQRQRDALDELIKAFVSEEVEESDAGTTHQKMPEPQGRGAYGTAARPGASETDRYRQSIADVGEESQDLEG